MKTPLWKLIAVCAILCFAAAGIASAAVLMPVVVVPPIDPSSDPTVNELFPTAGDAYLSFSNGSGTIPAGGQTAWQYETNDYVQSAVFTMPTDAVNALTADWQFTDKLGDGNTETWYVYLNGIAVASTISPDDSYNGDVFTVTGTVNFADIAPLAGGYQVELILQNTVPLGGGSVAWMDGGITGLSYDTPEPASLLLLGSGLALGGVLLSRKRRA